MNSSIVVSASNPVITVLGLLILVAIKLMLWALRENTGDKGIAHG